MDVSIVLVNYKTYWYLNDCIKSIKDKTHGLDYEIIVVDNDSGDNSCEMIQNNHPDIILLPSTTNLGFGRANNLGVSVAKGDFVFLLNTDTILLNNAIKILWDYMKTTPLSIGMCCANLYRKDLSPNHSYSLFFPSIFRFFLYRFHIPFHNEFYNETNQVKKVACVIGADMFIRKDVFEKVNGFDEHFFMYIEDGDLSYRINKIGFGAYNIPAAKIIHLQGVSSPTLRKLQWEIDGYSYYFLKNKSRGSMYSYIIVEFLSILSRIAFFFFTRNTSKRLMYQSALKYLFNKIR
ncbi:glycosyltransferase family 2 protein [Bacteroides sp.]|uniref:glycosyltransferase family 2 protein n=1 Tax=Bacteroides sp. TaxID=29523 RepID=UPI0025C279A1|nr:glycosyltransferase family 2 protein [Bacteroides sp.]